MADKQKLLLIDGNSLAFRAFFALSHTGGNLTNQDGLHTSAILGFNNMLEILLKTMAPTHILVAFDAGKTTFRTQMFPDYKGGRNKTPSELSEQFPYIRELLTARGITSYELPDYEADDIIGTLSLEAAKAGYEVQIVTGDRDLTQLVTPEITVQITTKGVNNLEEVTPTTLKETLDLTPAQIIDMKGLRGDTSDNYPGVAGVGEKTALKLLHEYHSVEGIYEHIDEMKKSKMRDNLVAQKDQAVLSKQLATINRQSPITVTLAETAYHGANVEALVDFYQQMNFHAALEKLEASSDGEIILETKAIERKEYPYTELNSGNLESCIAQLDAEQPIVFYLEMLEDNYHTAELEGFVIGQKDHWLTSDDVTLLTLSPLKEWLVASDRRLLTFDAKRTYVAANRLQLTLNNIEFDLLLASYLLDTNENSNDIGEVAAQHGYQDLQTDESFYGKGAKRGLPEDRKTFLQHLAQKGDAIATLESKLTEQLAKNDQFSLYETMEMPLAIVLAQMEIAGITVNAQTLNQMRVAFADKLNDLEKKIYQEAGEEFNINSPKQLGVILFEKMQLPVIKKTKTGYSTAVDVLEQLRYTAPIADFILEYRQIAKIQSTYIDGLLKVIHPDQKVHTRYVQTLTQTGRLSSVDPNLQNIPIRLEEGRQIRRAFVPRKAGWQIFSSDYSQIELRVLAHISGDENLQETFREDGDIHATTAMKIFNLASPDEVTPNMRRQAKAVNFGIVYGISDFGLSQNIGITRKQAKQFIEAYFEQYPGVKKYMNDSIAQAKEVGYVETLFKRRRYLPDIHAKNFNLRSFAERTAMNTPIQGSAADIIKVAMIQMQRMLKDEKLEATMLLQVHDELVFEAPASEIPVLEKLVPQVMDSAVKLAIPLKVESAFGDTWYDAK